MDRVTVACIRNPFDPLVSRETRRFAPGSSIGELICDFYPGGTGDYDIEVGLDGVRLIDNCKMDLIPTSGVSVVFCAVPRGGGDGKNPLVIVAMLAVMVAAPYAAGVLLGSTELLFGMSYVAGNFMMAAATAGIAIAGALAVNALLPPALPDNPGGGGFNSSPTYSWEPGTNYIVEGGVLPEIFGTHRVTPPLVGQYIETSGDKQYVNLLYAVAGHALDSITSVRINGNDVANFDGVTVETRLGAVTQPVIPYFNDTRTDVSVGAKLSDTAWTTRRTGGNAVQGLGVTIGLPKGLYYANDSGGLTEQTVKVYVEYRKVGDANWTRLKAYNTTPTTVTTGRWSAGSWYYDEMSGENKWMEVLAGSSNPSDHAEGEEYVVDQWIEPPGEAGYYSRMVFQWRWVVSESVQAIGTVLNDYISITAAQTGALHRVFYADNLPAGQYDVRCELVEALPTGSRYANDTYFESFQEIVYDDFTYPGTSLLAIRALATNQLSGSMPKVDCIATRSTVPVWTGSAYENKPASNPAWICYYLLNRGGSGGVAKERIIYPDYSSWADWCTTQGFTCNIYFDSAFSLRKALDLVSLNGRGTVVQFGSKFTVVADRPEPVPIQRFLFGMGNIVKDSFTEEYLPMDARANSIEVTYFDATLDYARQVVEIYSSDFDTTALSINKTQVTLYGCTDRSLASRYGKFLLNCNRYLTLTASWDSDVDALACMPGDVIEAAHDVPQWGQSGRIVSATGDSATLDRPVVLEAGRTYHITVRHQDDDSREELAITDGAGTYTTVHVSGSWAKTPAQYANYAVGEVNLVVKPMRVIKITRSQELRRKVTCLEYVPAVYIDGATIPPPPPPVPVPTVSNLKASEIYSGGTSTGVSLSWEGRAPTFYVYMRRDTGPYVFLAEVQGNSYQTVGLDPAVQYTFAVSTTPNPYDGATVTIALTGRDTLGAIPDPVFDDARCTYTDKIQLNWLPIASELLGFFEVRTDLNWGNPTNMIYQGKATSFTMKPTQASYTFNIKSHDTFLNYSVNYDSITLTHTVPVPVFVSIDGSSFGRVRIEWEPINDESYDVVEIWRHTTNDRTTSSLVGSIHSSVFVDASIAVSTTYYYWLRTKSIFGTYSAWESGVNAGHAVTTATINTADLADQAINKFKLANEIVFPEVVTELPVLPDGAYPEGKIVYLVSDGKLYRNDQVGGGGVNASDNFNRSSLGSNWTQQPGDSGTVVITGSAYCAASGSPDAFAYWSVGTFGNDQFAQAKIQNITNWGDDAGPAVRMSASANTCYRFVWLPGTNRWNLERVSSGSITNLDYATFPTPQNGDIVKITAIGTSIRGYINGQLICQATDANIASGQPGIYVGDSTTWLDDWYASEIGGGAIGWSAVVDGADILDGTVSHTALFDQIVAGQIAAGAVGADEIAANTIAVKHLVVADFSNIAANGDFESGSDHWTLSGGASVISYSSAPPKGHCLDLDGLHAAAYQDQTFPVATGESYFFSGYGSKYTVNGPLYVGLRVVDKDGGVTWPTINLPTSGGSGWDYFSGTITITAANARTGQVYVFNDASSTTRWLAAQIVCRRAANAEMIVDGAITANKLTANHLSAGNTESGTFQQSYTAPGDNNTTPGAGLKITGGAIEAYGDSQTFGGTLISSDGNFMICVGKKLTGTGATKRYPLNNTTNFTQDGRFNAYEWVSSAWVAVASIGYDAGTGSIIWVSATGTANCAISASAGSEHTIIAHTSGGDKAGIYGDGDSNSYGGIFSGGRGPLRLSPSGLSGAPTHSAALGTLWVTSAGVLYINTSGSTTWAKVGAQ